jgi:hypothetical protein
MSATYNWTYQPGKTNPYSITINSSANDVMPSNACYVALWGNDSTGNGSRMFPYRTISKAVALCNTGSIANGSYCIIGNGVYRESIPSFNNGKYLHLVGDGDVKIDGYTLSVTIAFVSPQAYWYNLKIWNLTIQQNSQNFNFTDCSFFGTALSSNNAMSFNSCTFNNCILRDYNGAMPSFILYGNTFYKTYINLTQYPILTNTQNNIFHTCNIDFIGAATQQFNMDFVLFYQCNVRCSTTVSISTVYYPNATPTGYTYCSTISTLKSTLGAYFTAQTSFCPYSQITDPLFNNLSYSDFSLSFSSPAKNMSYQGGYIGAKSIAYGLNPKANAVTSDFENDTANNITIADNSITFIDPTQIGTIITKPIVNSAARELQRFPVFGTNADRNGQYVDATADQASGTLSAGNTLNAGVPYSVEQGAITYNGTVYQPGDNFTSLESSPGTFTTSAGGVVRETTEAAARENIEVRFNDGQNPQITAGAALEALGRYYVVSGSITYNGTTYNAGQVFKADNTGTNTFSGGGAIQLIFHDSDPWYYFEIGTKPQSNNNGNVRTGAIVKGNGDPNFDRTPANVFNINQKFIQIRYTLQPNNLAP